MSRHNRERRKDAAAKQQPLPAEEQAKRAEANKAFREGLNKHLGYADVQYRDIPAIQVKRRKRGQGPLKIGAYDQSMAGVVAALVLRSQIKARRHG